MCNGYSNTSHAKENSESTGLVDQKRESDLLVNFNSDVLQEVCAHAIVQNDHNIDCALELFTSFFLPASNV